MQQGGLAGSIECECDEHFSRKINPAFTYSILLPSSTIALGALELDPDLSRRACSQGSSSEPFPTQSLVFDYLTLNGPKLMNNRAHLTSQVAHLTSQVAHPIRPPTLKLLPPTIFFYEIIKIIFTITILFKILYFFSIRSGLFRLSIIKNKI